MAILETMSLDKPVIGSRIGGISEQIRDGIEGILFEPDNVHELANAMDALADSPERVRDMGLHGCARLSEKYALSKHMDTLQALHKELLSRLQHEQKNNGFWNAWYSRCIGRCGDTLSESLSCH